jgi:hypothetical protein
MSPKIRRVKPVHLPNPSATNVPDNLGSLVDALNKKVLEPGLYMAVVSHDDWCSFLQEGESSLPCNCHRDIAIIGIRKTESLG